MILRKCLRTWVTLMASLAVASLLTYWIFDIDIYTSPRTFMDQSVGCLLGLYVYTKLS